MRKSLIILLLGSWLTHFAQQKPQVAFTIPEKDLIPEGIAYDATEKAFYLSSIHKRKILKISATGKVSDFVKSGQDNILEVLGMKVDGSGRLWACNNTPEHDTVNRKANIHVYDVKTGKMLKQYQVADGKNHLFNDLFITTSGDTYVTDSNGGAIYVIKKDKSDVEEFIAPGRLQYPNGITASADEKKLYVATGSGLGIVTIDVASKEFKPLTHPKFMVIGIDGLYRYINTLVGVQNSFFPDAILQFDLAVGGDAIANIQFLTTQEPTVDLPTTGVIAGDEFYFIANSQLLQIIGNRGVIKNPEKLNDTLIMKIKLN